MAKKQDGTTSRQDRLIPGWLWMFFGMIMTLGIGFALYLSQPWTMLNKAETDDTTEVANPLETEAETASAEEQTYEFYDILPEQQVTPIPEEPIKAIEASKTKTTENANNVEPDVVLEIEDLADDAYGVDMPAMMTPDDDTLESPDTTTAPTPTDSSTSTPSTSAPPTVDPIEQKILAEEETDYILQINSYLKPDAADKRRAEVLLAGVDAQVIRNKLGDGQVIYQVVSMPTTNKSKLVQLQRRLTDYGIDSLLVERRR